jgi:pyruvate kinase
LVRKLDSKRTKIVCTIGPASDSTETLRAMIRAGMDVARINFSHGDDETHLKRIERIRAVAAEENAVIAILCDLQGPKFRLGKIAQEPVILKKGDTLRITSDLTANGSNNVFPMPHVDFVQDVQPGEALLLDDGQLEFKVIGKEGDKTLVCDVVVGGPLSSRKGVSAPHSYLKTSALPDKDRHDLQVAIRAKADFIAMSFVRSAEDLRELRTLMHEFGGDAALIAKIEKHEAITNIASIIEETDGIMVARGDLGVETPADMVPIYQKDIIRQCNRAGKPVITATQMLQSMTSNPRPTRAEATDVANAIWDGSDAVMLSNETAGGQFPVEAVSFMAQMARNAEASFDRDARQDFRIMQADYVADHERVSDSVSRAATRIASDVGAKLIITSTMSGYTAQRVARQRPNVRILALTPDEKTFYRLALTWGVVPMLIPEYSTIDEMLRTTIRAAYDAEMVERGDTVLVVAGMPFRVQGATNFLKTHVVGELNEVPETREATAAEPAL